MMRHRVAQALGQVEVTSPQVLGFLNRHTPDLGASPETRYCTQASSTQDPAGKLQLSAVYFSGELMADLRKLGLCSSRDL